MGVLCSFLLGIAMLTLWEIIPTAQPLHPEEKTYSNLTSTIRANKKEVRKQKRSLPPGFASPPTCSVTVTELVGLVRTLRQATENIQNPSNSTGSQLRGQSRLPSSTVAKSRNECSNLISDIQNEAQSIISKVERIKQLARDGMEYSALQAEYSRRMTELQKKFDDLKRKANQDYAELVALAWEDKQRLQNKINEQLKTIKMKDAELTESKIQAISSHIALGHDDKAIEKFNELAQRDDWLKKIISDAYQKSPQQLKVENVDEFATKLNEPYQALAYVYLYESIKAGGTLSQPQMLIFLHCATRVQLHPTLSLLGLISKIIYVQNLKAAREQVVEVLTFWEGSIQRGVFHPINSFLSSPGKAKESFLPYIPRLLRGNFDNVFAFVKQLPWTSGRAEMLREMVYTLIVGGSGFTKEMMALAFTIASSERHSDTPGDAKSILSQAQSRIPWKIRDLYALKNCQLQSTYHDNEHLYASNLNQGKNLEIFTWIPGGAVRQSSWRLMPQDRNRFQLLNTYQNGYYLGLQATGGTYDSERRYAFATRELHESHYDWFIDPVVQGGRQVFTIRNAYFWEYLYTAIAYHRYNSERRRVFTWIPKDMVHQGYWDITCS